MAGLLGHFEGWLERAVEGGTRALFRHRLQPIELAKAATRAMQGHRLVGPDGIEVPNAFTISLNPADYAELDGYRASLETRIERYLGEFADERGLVPVGAISVAIVSDEAVRRRTLRIAAEMADPFAGPSTRAVESPFPTQHLPRVRREEAPPAPVANAQVVLLLEDGREIGMEIGSLRIGRALDNDLVIADSRISRYHAQILRDAYGTIVRDLGSTNGTAIDGRSVQEDRLADGDGLSLGGYLIQVRVGHATGRAPRADRR